MMRTKAFAALGALAMIAAAGCSEDRAPLAPRAERPSAAVAAAVSGVGTTLVRATPLAYDITVTRTIGPAGGDIDIPAAGLHVVVPRGALAVQTTLSATALKGDMVAYEFGPHGTRFAVPLVVVQKSAGTDLAALPAGTLVQAGYFSGVDALDAASHKARLAEVIPTFGVSTGDAVAFLVWHFSGYTVQWGFHSDADHD